MLNFARKNKSPHIVVLLFLCFAFFILYSYFSFTDFKKYSSPDETANHFFSKQFIEKGNFKYYEPMVSKFEGIIRPRSFGSDGDYLIPSSFIGLPLLYGFFGKIFGAWIIYYLSPLIVSFSVFFFFLLIRKFFSERQAFLASLLLFVQPVFVFYAMRPFWHNGLFVAVLIIAFYCLFSLFCGKWWRYLIFGLIFGLVIILRTSEIVWLIPLLFLIMFFNRRKIKVKYIPWILLGIVIVMTPLFYYQLKTYGSVFTTGYLASIYKNTGYSQRSLLDSAVILKIILPYGIRFIYLLKVFFYFSLKLMFLSFTLGLLGIALIFKRYLQEQKYKERCFYCFYYLMITLWLMVYYGSYEFYEYFNQQIVAIGISYVRYWLPLYVFSLPLVIVFIDYISGKIFNKNKNLALIFFMAIILFGSLSQFLFEPYYGLKIQDLKFMNEARLKFNFVLENTPKDAIIIAGQNDKTYWPDRKVIGYDGLTMPPVVIRNLPGLFKTAPIYYDAFDINEVTRLNNSIKENNLVLSPLDPNQSIYKLSGLNDE